MFVIELLEFVDDFVITGVTAAGIAGVVIQRNFVKPIAPLVLVELAEFKLFLRMRNTSGNTDSTARQHLNQIKSESNNYEGCLTHVTLAVIRFDKELMIEKFSEFIVKL